MNIQKLLILILSLFVKLHAMDENQKSIEQHKMEIPRLINEMNNLAKQSTNTSFNEQKKTCLKVLQNIRKIAEIHFKIASIEKDSEKQIIYLRTAYEKMKLAQDYAEKQLNVLYNEFDSVIKQISEIAKSDKS